MPGGETQLADCRLYSDSQNRCLASILFLEGFSSNGQAAAGRDYGIDRYTARSRVLCFAPMT
jgi:hypothetical protein